MPPPPVTGFSNSSCFLSYTHDCSKKISREHYISKVILDLFGDVAIEGMPWQEEGQKISLRPNALTAKILCTRHNTALSPLDQMGGAIFRAVRSALQHADRPSISKKHEYFLIDGSILEMWGLKVLLGLAHGGLARAKIDLNLSECLIETSVINQVFFGSGLLYPCGMYSRPSVGNIIGDRILMYPIVKTNNVVCGLNMVYQGLELVFIFDAKDCDPNELCPGGYHRPSIVDFVGTRRTSRIFVPWSREGITDRRISMGIGQGRRS